MLTVITICKNQNQTVNAGRAFKKPKPGDVLTQVIWGNEEILFYTPINRGFIKLNKQNVPFLKEMSCEQ